MQLTSPVRLALMALLLTLGGCAGAPGPREAPAEARDPAQAARALEQAGEFTAAADAYLAAAAEADPERATALRLDAARVLVRAAELARAEQVVRGTRAPAAPATLALERDLLLAEILLGQARAAEALRQLPPTLPDNLPPALRRQHLELRARALLQSGDALASARERLLLAGLLDRDDAVLANQFALLEALRSLGPALPAPSAAEPDLAGWIALAGIASGPPRHAVALEGEIAAWRQAFPDHPAARELLARVIEERKTAPAPASIALLLPHEGPAAAAASAVRDGFLAALYLGLAQGDVPVTVRFYDSSGSNAWAAYTQAVSDGAEVVVGPLRKEAVAELAGAPSLPVPVLALNRIGDAPAHPALRQFSLAPEGEAEEVADRAWYDGHRQVVILAPATDFGQRIAQAFRARWERLGGAVLEQRGYDPAENDYSEPITGLLGLAASEARSRELRGILRRPLEFEPRRRRDADAIFIAALPRQAQLLKPQLAFHHAADLPVYATSHAYAPDATVDQNRDLQGVRFCDMPWTLGATDPELAGGITTASGGLSRLFALGADAFHLLPYLPRLQADPGTRLDAQTGLLWLDGGGRVHRQLLCAEMAEAGPRLLGYTPPPQTAASGTF